MSSVTYAAILINAYGGIHGNGEGFASEADAMAWAERELSKVKRRVHFAEALGLRIVVLEKEMANV
jgi:hypothetical protein